MRRGLRAAIGNERGIALVIVMVLSAIALAVMSALIYMVVRGTEISGMQKRYATAYEAGKGGVDVATQVIALRGSGLDTALAGLIAYNATTPSSCVVNATQIESRTNQPCLTGIGNFAAGLESKLNLPTECWKGCNSTATINPADATSFDMRFELGVAPLRYRVLGKIIDTKDGNAGGDEGLLKGGVVSANTGEVAVQHRPFFYTIELDAQNTSVPAERAKINVLYQY